MSADVFKQQVPERWLRRPDGQLDSIALAYVDRVQLSVESVEVILRFFQSLYFILEPIGMTNSQTWKVWKRWDVFNMIMFKLTKLSVVLMGLSIAEQKNRGQQIRYIHILWLPHC